MSKKNKIDEMLKNPNKTIKDYNELAELILKTIAEENKKDEEEAKAKKDKKESKKESKEDKKEDKKQSKKEDKKDDKKQSKKDNSDWLKGEPSLSDKIIKITSPIWYEKIIIQGEEHNYQLRHKMTKNGNIRVRLQNDKNDFVVKVIKDKNNEIDFNIKKIVNKKGVECEEKYDHDFIEEYGHKIPFKVIIMPLVDFYYGIHDFNTCTEGNTKIHNNSIIMDANIRKEGYILDPKDLTIEDLEELKKDKDNMIGVEIEYFRRAEEVEDVKEENKDNKETETKMVAKEEVKADEKIVGIIEEIDKELKYKIVSEIPAEERFNIIREQMLKDNKVYDKIATILKDEKTNIKELHILGINEKNLAELLAPKTANEKISECLKENKKVILDDIKSCTNIGERSVFFVHKVRELVKVDEIDMRTFLSLSKEWDYFVFKEKDVAEYLHTLLLEHMLATAF